MEEKQPNEFGKAMQEWWDSDACKELQKANEEAKQRAVGKYFMLSEEEKIDMVGGIFYIICKAEEKGVSHRGLMNELGIYPSGFWCSELLDIHNALYEYYDKRKQKQELDIPTRNLYDFYFW
jgi:hypothetical protein